MPGGQIAKIRRGGVTVYEMSAIMRSTVSPLQYGPVTLATLHSHSRMALKSCRMMVDTLIRLGAVEEDGGEIRPRLRLTSLGRYDILGDGAKSALMAFTTSNTVVASLLPGSGKHPTSFRVLANAGGLVKGKPGGVWTITEAGRVVLNAALAEMEARDEG